MHPKWYDNVHCLASSLYDWPFLGIQFLSLYIFSHPVSKSKASPWTVRQFFRGGGGGGGGGGTMIYFLWVVEHATGGNCGEGCALIALVSLWFYAHFCQELIQGGDLCCQYPLFAVGYNIICNIPSRVMFTLLVNLGHSFPSLRSPVEVVYIVTLLHTLSLSCLFMFLTLSHHVRYLLFFST